MSQPIPFSEIVERIKDIISPSYNRNVFDKDVAEALGISPVTLRAYKAANYYPYKNLIIFCMDKNISIDWLLFDLSFTPKTLDR